MNTVFNSKKFKKDYDEIVELMKKLPNKERVLYAPQINIHPTPTDVLYVNELSLTGKAPYKNKNRIWTSPHGRTKSNGGILPDDNMRIYVPMDLNADIIMRQLYSLIAHLGCSNESE